MIEGRKKAVLAFSSSLPAIGGRLVCSVIGENGFEKLVKTSRIKAIKKIYMDVFQIETQNSMYIVQFK